MAAAVAMRGGSSDGGGFDKVVGMDSGKYVRYTPEQVEALERVYAHCPKPTSSRRQQLLRECAILANIEQKQIKVWFQNRRCRDKQRKESSRLQAVNRKLTAMNKLLMEENERLQKQVSQLVHENAHMRQQLQNTSLANDTSCESNVTTPQNPLRDASNPSGLLSIAEETLTEFLSKATGTAIDWVQMPGMKSVPPAVLVRFLREHRSEWADYNIDVYLASALKTSACSLPGLWPMRFSGSQIIMPLAHTVENEEILEVVRLEGQPLNHDEALVSRDIHLLQDLGR